MQKGKIYFFKITLAVLSGLYLIFTTEVRGQNESHDFFEDFGYIDPAVWQVATWIEHGGQTGTERCYAQNGLLHMIFINDSGKGFLNAAIQTHKEFLYGKWEVRAKPSSVAGVLNSIYTIDWDNTSDRSSQSDGTKQEIDIEFLTSSFGPGKGEVHLAVHQHGRESFNINPDLALPFNPSDDFHIWGFEILPDRINWYVDNQLLYTYIYNQNDISIDEPYQFKMNVWTDHQWIKGPPVPDVVSTYLIDWIRFTSYSE